MTTPYIDPINTCLDHIWGGFKKQGYAIIDESQWSPLLSSKLKYLLEKPQLLRIEKVVNSSQIKLSYPQEYFGTTSQIQKISLQEQKVDNAPRLSYQTRNFWQKFLPIAIFSMIYFIACYALGQGLERLVSMYFLFGIPFIIGALISYAIQLKEPIRSKEWFKALNYSVLLCFLVSAFILREGSICLILASPFLLVGIYLGAIIMDGLCHYFWKPSKIIYSLAALPLLLLLIPEQRTDYFGNTHQSVVINASPSQIWQHINQAEAIKPEEVKDALMYKIGVPYPVSGITKQTQEGLIRYSTWQKGIHFDELIDNWQPNQFVSWRYRFASDSIPKGALDDHVTIGGKYFNLLDTSYRLIALNSQQTRLDINVNYRVSTDMNLYTGFIADTLIANFSSVILNFYKVRSEAPPITTATVSTTN